MAEISLYLTNVNVSLGQTMDVEKVGSAGQDYEKCLLSVLYISVFSDQLASFS